MPISDDDLKMVRHILMYDDETVMDAIVAYRDNKAADWWTLVVDSGGKYAVTSYATIVEEVKKQQKALLDQQLGALIGTLLEPVEAVVDFTTGTAAAARDQAGATTSLMAIVLHDGEVRGLISMKTSRAAGLFGSDLVKLAGQYADLPSTGLVSRRRQEAMAAKKKKE